MNLMGSGAMKGGGNSRERMTLMTPSKAGWYRITASGPDQRRREEYVWVESEKELGPHFEQIIASENAITSQEKVERPPDMWVRRKLGKLSAEIELLAEEIGWLLEMTKDES